MKCARCVPALAQSHVHLHISLPLLCKVNIFNSETKGWPETSKHGNIFSPLSQHRHFSEAEELAGPSVVPGKDLCLPSFALMLGACMLAFMWGRAFLPLKFSCWFSESVPECYAALFRLKQIARKLAFIMEVCSLLLLLMFMALKSK